MTGPVTPSSPALKHGVGLIDLVMLGAGTAIGAAIFSVLGPASQVGGAGILISAGLAAIPMIVFALVYAYMASALPKTAASYEWQRILTKPWIAFAVVWMRILSNAVVMIVLGRVLVSYLSMVIDLPAAPTMLGLFFLISYALQPVAMITLLRALGVRQVVLLATGALLALLRDRLGRIVEETRCGSTGSSRTCCRSASTAP
mgnify:CR=1 FL=1